MPPARRWCALALLASACAAPKHREVQAVFDPHAPARLAPLPASAACGVPGTSTPPAAVAQLSATRGISCARLVDGGVWCWGARGVTLVDNDVIGSLACPVATRVPELSPAADLRGTCVVRKDGTATCGRLQGWEFEPAAADALAQTPPEYRFAGGICTLDRGTVSCRFGERARILSTEIAAMVQTDRGLVIIRDDHVLLLLGVCGGELCDEPLAALESPAAAIEQLGPHTCILTRAGHVWCERVCTDLRCEQLGFVEVEGVADATQIAVGEEHGCALRRDGTVVCWGESRCGEAGGAVQAGTACAPGRTPVPPTTILWAR